MMSRASQPGQAGTKFEIRSTKFDTNSNAQKHRDERIIAAHIRTIFAKSPTYNMRPPAIFCNLLNQHFPPWLRNSQVWGGIHVVKDLRVATPMESIARGKFGGGKNWTQAFLKTADTLHNN
jgi:hypothetical protein